MFVFLQRQIITISTANIINNFKTTKIMNNKNNQPKVKRFPSSRKLNEWRDISPTYNEWERFAKALNEAAWFIVPCGTQESPRIMLTLKELRDGLLQISEELKQSKLELKSNR